MLEALVGILGTAVLGVFGWSFSISNRITKMETKQEDLPKYLDAKFDGLDARLERIERAMNGSLSKH
jgi:hypothetical protein